MKFRRWITALVLCSVLTSFVNPVQAYEAPPLPAPGTMVNLSPAFAPVLLKGIQLHADNPLEYNFILEPGQQHLTRKALQQEAQRLIKYFLTAMTVPEKDMWVNLSPYEKDRIIEPTLGQTSMGRDMLAQDYLLKQLTASLIYPEKELGQKFWDAVYEKSRRIYGNATIPVNTFNKVWIVADRADVYQHGNVAYVVDAHLKVMLEEDYKAFVNHTHPQTNSHSVASQMIRQIILPEIEHEVNNGQNFTALRQMFYSMILASWYKVTLKQALLNQIYTNTKKVRGLLDVQSPLSPDDIYKQYLKAYKKGVFNYIKDDVKEMTKAPLHTKYFSGGLRIATDKALRVVDTLSGANQRKLASQVMLVDVPFSPQKDKAALSRIGPDFQMEYTRVMSEREIKSRIRLLSAQSKRLSISISASYGEHDTIEMTYGGFPGLKHKISKITAFTIVNNKLYVSYLNEGKPSFGVFNPLVNSAAKVSNMELNPQDLPKFVRVAFGIDKALIVPIADPKALNLMDSILEVEQYSPPVRHIVLQHLKGEITPRQALVGILRATHRKINIQAAQWLLDAAYITAFYHLDIEDFKNIRAGLDRILTNLKYDSSSEYSLMGTQIARQWEDFIIPPFNHKFNEEVIVRVVSYLNEGYSEQVQAAVRDYLYNARDPMELKKIIMREMAEEHARWLMDAAWMAVSFNLTKESFQAVRDNNSSIWEIPTLKNHNGRPVSSMEVALKARVLFNRWEVLRESDEAMTTMDAPTKQPPGGIDLDANKMNMNMHGDLNDIKTGVFDTRQLEEIRTQGFDGMGFTINSIVPANLPQLLGL